MEKYDIILKEIYDYLSYPDVIYNNDVISAYDLVVIMNNAYKKYGVFYEDEELKRRLNKLYPSICKMKGNIIQEVKFIGGKDKSKVKIVRNFSDGRGDLVTYLCKDNEEFTIYIEGEEIEEEIIEEFRCEFYSLFESNLESLVVPVSFPTEVVSDGVLTVSISYDEFKGASTHVTVNSDKNGIVERKYLGRESLREILNKCQIKVLKKMPVDVSKLSEGTREYVSKCIGNPEVIRKLRKY